MGKIYRDDMLELTRRMTIKRNCFSRIAGAYFDEEGYIDGTFNTHFLNLSAADKQRNLDIAKAIPFAETNVELTEKEFTQAEKGPNSMWQLLMALKDCELKNDALLDVFYEKFAELHPVPYPHAVYFFFGSYDVPRKGSDHVSQWESEEVYSFLICAVCPVHGEYEADDPVGGFLFPAFKYRSADYDRMNVFRAEKNR